MKNVKYSQHLPKVQEHKQFVEYHYFPSRLMSALPVTTVPRELVTDLHIRVQWDFTESFLLRCRYRIAVFASRVTTVMN